MLVISGPLHPQVGRIYNQKEIDQKYNKYLYDQARKNGFVYLSEKDLPEFSQEDFIDLTHLKSDGRKRLTEFLADSIGRELQPELTGYQKP